MIDALPNIVIAMRNGNKSAHDKEEQLRRSARKKDYYRNEIYQLQIIEKLKWFYTHQNSQSNSPNNLYVQRQRMNTREDGGVVPGKRNYRLSFTTDRGHCPSNRQPNLTARNEQEAKRATSFPHIYDYDGTIYFTAESTQVRCLLL